MPNDMLQTVEKIRGGFQVDGYISVTQLSRSTDWKKTLQKMDAMQVLDRNKTAGVLMTKDAYVGVMDYIDALEKELDAAQVSTILAERQHMDDWTEGDDLAGKAKDSLLKRSDYLQGLINEDNE
ncbi:hypothetical protein [Lentibacillus sp. CBA3610]|uniref:hypothetical protein n=1 Tax=Lentibacillus sp. CBA3610 TaxID=2518176 RepID=UPI001595D9A2|nr:hypothetical protein [Lentibacillus sp. CBA3610]QKY70442.1 hypothetical protein Len3610_13330 [Lentibacillus sp. CBA3610]